MKRTSYIKGDINFKLNQSCCPLIYINRFIVFVIQLLTIDSKLHGWKEYYTRQTESHTQEVDNSSFCTFNFFNYFKSVF